jgi:predicted RNase H-like HicB family nuclease
MIRMTYDVLLTKTADNQYVARAMLLPGVAASGTSEAEAIDRLRAELLNLLANSRIVKIDLPAPGNANPWLQSAGIFRDDPTWEAFQAELATYRSDTPS